MEKIIIYDNNGTIYVELSGDVQEPIGIQFLKVDIPNDKIIERIDTQQVPHKPIFKDRPISEFENVKVKLEQAEADNLTTLEALAEVYEMVLALQV